MKPRRSNPLSARFFRGNIMSTVMVVSLTALAFEPAAQAANQIYQNASALNTWNTTDANWDAGVLWTNDNTATFQGAGETVTVNSVATSGITIGSTGYTLTGGTITLKSPATITANQNATIASSIGGSVGLTSSGTGILTLSGNNNYTGATTITAGTLQISGSSALPSGAVANSGTLLMNVTGSSSLANVITGTGNLSLNNTVTLAGSGTSQGKLWVNGSGTLNIQSGTSATFGIAWLDSYNSGARTTINITGGSLAVTGAASDNRDSWYDITQTGGSVSFGSLVANGYETNNGGGTTGYSNYNLNGGDFSVGNITGGDGVTAWSRGIKLNLGGGTVKATAATSTWSGHLSAVAATTSSIDANGNTIKLTRNVAGTGTLNLSASTGTIEFNNITTVSPALSGSTAITKTGASTTTFSGAGTHTGTLTISAGRLNIGSGGSVASATTIASGGTLGGKGTISGSVTASSGSFIALTPATAGALTLANPNITGQPTITFDTMPAQAQSPLTLFNYTGTLTGTPSTDLKGLTGFANPVITDTGSAVTLAFTTQNLTWGGGTGTWDLKTTANWNSGAQQFAWGDAVTFDDTSGVPTAITLAGELKPSSITVNSSTNNFTISGSTGNFISGTAGLLKSGSSILTMNGPNTFTGGTVISQGAIYIQSAGALGTGTVTLGDASTGSNNTALYIDTNRVNYVVPIAISANGTGTATLGTRSNVGGSGPSNGFNGITLAHDLVLDSNAADRTDYQNISGTGNITISGAGRTVFTTANTFTGNLTISPSGTGGHFQNGVATASATNYIPDASNVTVTDFTGATQAEFRLSSQSETIGGLNGNGTIDTNSINTTLTLGGGNGNGSFSGTIQNGGANTVTLTKTGTGTQVLSGANTYTGVTTISGGVLQFGTTASLYNNDQLKWAAANLIVASGATAAFNVGGAGEFTSSNIDAIRVLSNVASGVTATAGFKSGSSIGLDTTNAPGGSFTYSSVIANHVSGSTTDTLGVAKLGAGTLVLSGASTYSGATTVVGGTLEMTNGPVKDSAFVVRPGGTLKLGYSLTGTGYSAAMTVQGAGTSSSNGLYILRGKYINRNTMFLDSAPTVVRSYGTSGRVTINGFDNGGNNFRVYAAASGSSSDEFIDFNGAGGGGNSYGYTMTVDAGTNSATGDFTINGGIINGGGGFTKAGSGSLVLAGQCTYTSALKIAAGSVITSGNNRLSTSAGVSIGNGSNSGKLVLLGSSQTVSGVVAVGTGTGNRVVGGSSTLSTLTVSNTADGALSAIIGGTGTNEDNIALAKSGAGVLTLANASNSYTGGTTVNGGTLRVNDASGNAAGTGTITVNSGGTLDGYGNLNVGVIVSPTGGTVAGGELGGTPLPDDALSVDSLTFQDTGVLAVVPGISSIDVTNDLTVSGGAGSVAVNIGTTPLSVGTYTLVTHGALSGTGVSAFAIGTNPGGPFTYTLSDNGSALQLTVATSALFWNGNNGASWSTANNWKNGSGSAVSFSNGAAVVFNDDATSLNVDLSSVDVSPLSVTFANSSSYDYTLAGTKAITGSAALLKGGTGSVTLNNTNSFTGDVTINQGTLNASSITDSGMNSALGKGSAIILGGGTLGYTGVSAATTDRSITANATSTIRVDSGALTITGLVESTANLNKTGAGTLVLDNAANYIVGSLSITGGAVQVDEAVKLGSTSVALAGGTLGFSGSAVITASQAISLGTGGGVINVTNTDANGVTLSGAITGSTGLTKNGTGKLTLSNNKNFAGGVTVNNGTLYISGGGWYTNPFGQANTITINPGGKVQTAGAHGLGVDQNTVHINGGTLQLGAEQYISGLQMTGGLLTGGQLRTWGGTMTFNASATGAVIDSPGFQMVGATTLNVADGAAADDLTVSSGIFGSVGLIKSGDGKLVLQGINTHTGNTTVNAGTLQLKDDARLTFVIPASGASNKITGAGTAELDGDFQINTTAAAALTTGTWTLEDVTGTATYGSTFQVVESTGTPWTSSGDKWTKVSGTQLWTFDETTGVLTLTIAGYDAWATAYGLTGNDALRTSDPDNDGFSNLQEFLFGASPVASTGSLVTMSQSGGNLVLTWLQRETGSAYQLKESTTLANGSWSASSLVPTLDDQTGVATDYDRWKVTITPASGKAFFRVEGTEN